VAGERGKGLAFDECLRRKAVLFLERQLGIARESKEVIDHEGKAYLIPCQPCQLKRAKDSGVRSVRGGGQTGHAPSRTRVNMTGQRSFAQFDSFKNFERQGTCISRSKL
jgi:hypothetical protein